MTLRPMELGSGRWQVEIAKDANRREYMQLTDRGRPANSMRVRLPFSWRQLPPSQLQALARDPEVRLWRDEHGVIWRIAAVGPGTSYPFPLGEQHLVFDSAETWAGITRFDPPPLLGDMTQEELIEYRDRMRDLGGERKSYRPPEENIFVE